MKTAIVDVDADHVEKTCACGCGLRFVVFKTSKRIYYSNKHQEAAKALRRKFKHAGVVYAGAAASLR